MPTYEYKCDACGNEFEEFQSITSKPTKKCPKCGKSKVRRLISAGAGMIFKGSGFYITDYREAGYAEKAKADNGGGEKSDKSESKSDAKSDGKPETKSEPKTETKAESKGESTPAAEPKPAKTEPKPSKSAKK